MTPKLCFIPMLLPLAASALAQDGTTAPPAATSLTPLLIITITVLALVVLTLWLVPKARPRRNTPQAPHPDQPAETLSAKQQAIGAVTAFEKARLMGKKVANAAPSNVARGGEAGDEHPS
jgi:hypothetical protein